MKFWVVTGLLVLTMGRSEAFCGFFVAGSNEKLTNNASQVAILREGNRTSLTMANTYKGPPENFAMVVPVPVVLHKEDVKTLPLDVFTHIDALSAPRLVEYWEQDPCTPPRVAHPQRRRGAMSTLPAPPPKSMASSHGVTIEAQFVAGEYQILILSAKESGGLEAWLVEHHYKIPAGAAEALAPYVRSQMKFFVAKVDIDKVKRDAHGVVQLSPLRVTYESNEVRLPVRLGLLNAESKQDLIVYLLNPDSRFEVANYSNVFIPTNLDVVEQVKNNFASFYAELFDATLAARQGKAVVTEYAWQTTSCDPCPTEPLSPGDLATLGASGQQSAPVRGRWAGGYAPWVLTRMHARYDRTSLSDDLVFKTAPPMMGGRAEWNGKSADAGAQPSPGANNFQARYIVRNYWKGAVSCKDPHFDVWGGPPGSGDGYRPKPAAAQGLATAPRGKIALRTAVQSPVPTLGLSGQPPQRHK
ncbi:MAG: DUF2330 domain-containing protein [Polyangia bacterium]